MRLDAIIVTLVSTPGNAVGTVSKPPIWYPVCVVPEKQYHVWG